MADKIKQRRDTQANWEAVNPILDQGELGWITDRNTGKLGDGATAFNDLLEIHGNPEGWINVKDFGAKGDGITDDTQAIQDALSYAYTHYQGAWGWSQGIPTIFFPNGIYEIKQSNVLFNGMLYGRFFILGNGQYSTILEYDVPTTIATDYMIKNDNYFGFTTFSNISFRSKNSNGNFFYSYSDEPYHAPQSIKFENVTFANFSSIFTIEGNTMNSEFTFLNCKLWGFSNYAFSFNDSQAKNWRFFSVDIESFSGTAFKFLKGSNIHFYKGSIIPEASTAKVIEIPIEAYPDYIGPGNSPICFSGVVFEIKNDSLLIDKQTQSSPQIIFEGCTMGGWNIATTKPIRWDRGGYLEFKNCYDFDKYGMEWFAIGDNKYDSPLIVIDSPNFPMETFLSNSTFTLTSFPENTALYPLFDVRSCSNMTLNNTKMRPQNGSLSNISQTWHSISTSWEKDTIAQGTFNIIRELPVKSVFIREIKFLPQISTTTDTSVTVQITNQDASVILMNFTYDPNTDTTEKVSNPNFYVPLNQTLFLSIYGSDLNPVKIKGSLWMLY